MGHKAGPPLAEEGRHQWDTNPGRLWSPDLQANTSVGVAAKPNPSPKFIWRFVQPREVKLGGLYALPNVITKTITPKLQLFVHFSIYLNQNKQIRVAVLKIKYAFNLSCN